MIELKVRFEKVKREAIKRAKKKYLGKEDVSSDEESDTQLKPKKKPKIGWGPGDKKYTISMSGMMGQVLTGQDAVQEGQKKLEERVIQLEGKVETLIKIVNRQMPAKGDLNDDESLADRNEGKLM